MLRVRMAAVGLEFDVDSISDVDWEVPGHYRYLQPKPSLLHVGQRGSTGSIGQQIARAHEQQKVLPKKMGHLLEAMEQRKGYFLSRLRYPDGRPIPKPV